MYQKSTLRERYEEKAKLGSLKEKLKIIDENVSSYDERDSLILEAFDKQQISAAVDIVKKLKAINFGPLVALAQARDAAVADVTKVLSGSDTRGMVRKIIDLFKDEKENPLVDALAFSNALHNFFSQFTEYVTALGSNAGDDQTLGTIITGQSSENLDMASFGSLSPENRKKLTDLQNVIIKGLKPEGAIAAAGKSWSDKYLKGRKGLQQLAKNMLSVKLSDVKTISNSVISSLKNVEAVSQAAAGAAQQGAVGTTGSTGTGAARSSQASAGTATTKPGTVAPGAQVSGGTSSSSKAFEALKDAGVDRKHNVSPAALKAIIDALDDLDHLK